MNEREEMKREKEAELKKVQEAFKVIAAYYGKAPQLLNKLRAFNQEDYEHSAVLNDDRLAEVLEFLEEAAFGELAEDVLEAALGNLDSQTEGQ